jgi:imidazolonepropionase-like amidohydrolase
MSHAPSTWVRAPRLCAALMMFAAHASAAPLAFEHARLLPIDGAAIADGVLIVDDGRIVAVGAAGEVRIPADARRIDLRGKQVMPGLVDTHSHVGIATRPLVGAHLDFNESSGPVQPALRALDAINPDDPAIRMAIAGGVTTANVMPGSGNVIGGQTAYVKLRGTRIEQMLIGGTIGGLKMANGENAKNAYGSRGQKPVTRMAEAALAREQFVRAQEYRAARQRWEDRGKGDGEAAPARDLGMEALLEVLDGKRIVQHHSHRADDIASVLRLADEFGFRVVLHHGTEAYKLADVLAAKKIPVSLIVIDSPGGKHEAAEYRYDGAAQLERAGVRLAIHTDDFINSSRFLLREAALAVRGGLTRGTALAAVTLNAAAMLDLDRRVGSLTVGKDADFIVLDGDPLAAATVVEQTWIDGVQVFDRNDPVQRRYAVGGFAAGALPAGEE